MIRKFEFSLGTHYNGSTVKDIIEYDMEDYEDYSEELFMDIVKNDYEEWVWNENYGGLHEVK